MARGLASGDQAQHLQFTRRQPVSFDRPGAGRK
jgi:hypothetical protein